MNDKCDLIAILVKSLKLILQGNVSALSPIEDRAEYSDCEKTIINLFNELITKYKEALDFIKVLSSGDLSKKPPYKNYLIDPFKQLHSELKHLVWQTQRLAAGDLEQHVDFLGSFSDSFNSLIESLREKRALTEEIRRSKDFYKTLVRIAPDGICNINLDGSIIYISETGYKMFGYSDYTEMVDKSIFDYIMLEYHEELTNLFLLLLKGEMSGVIEYKIINKNGATLWNESNIALLQNEFGVYEMFLVMFRDCTKRKEMEQKILDYSIMMEARASTDQMTGFFNHTEGMRLLTIELNKTRMTNKPLTVCFIDMDYLKYVNDNFGHLEGDRMILALTKCIKESTRNTDHICRMGGDEFLIIFPESTTEEIKAVFERINKKVSELNKKVHFKKPLSYSYGLATSTPEKRLTPEIIIKTADNKMYEHKRNKKHLGINKNTFPGIV